MVAPLQQARTALRPSRAWLSGLTAKGSLTCISTRMTRRRLLHCNTAHPFLNPFAWITTSGQAMSSCWRRPRGIQAATARQHDHGR